MPLNPRFNSVCTMHYSNDITLLVSSVTEDPGEEAIDYFSAGRRRQSKMNDFSVFIFFSNSLLPPPPPHKKNKPHATVLKPHTVHYNIYIIFYYVDPVLHAALVHQPPAGDHMTRRYNNNDTHE